MVFRDIVVKTVNQLRKYTLDQGLEPARMTYYLSANAHRVRMLIDRAKLNQVVYNLLINSIKYAEDDVNQFDMRIIAEETRESFLIKFQDWGIGIPKSSEEKIFDRGFRTEAAKRKNVSGSGLGLPIARANMREIGGELLLVRNSKPTEFHIVLPKSLQVTP